MKLIIQIPCLNEEATLPATLAELPRHIDGIDEIEILIINDGSTDDTVRVAREHGVHHVISHAVNKGLATAWQTGINASLALGADIIVNTDADNQYPGRYIADLVRPILASEADIVIADRQTSKIHHFSRTKKTLQALGSAVVRHVSNTDVPDAPSGFRAYSREAALRLNVLTYYTYTLETIIQAGHKNLKITSVPVTTNAKLRESRLISSNTRYVLRSTTTILRFFMLYMPLRTFTYFSLPFVFGGMILWARYGALWLMGETARGSNVQSVIVGAALLLIGFLIFLFGLIGDLIAINRRLHEETLYHLKQATLMEDATPPIDADLHRTPYIVNAQMESYEPEAVNSR
jgi:glycosyltransferase involved in cell wall biosynthesis